MPIHPGACSSALATGDVGADVLGVVELEDPTTRSPRGWSSVFVGVASTSASGDVAVVGLQALKVKTPTISTLVR